MAIIPKIAKIVKTIITFILLRPKIPKYIGLDEEAIVPTAETKPTPNALALPGYN